MQVVRICINSLGGAAFAFVGLVFILSYGTTPDFLPGGVLDIARLGERANRLLVVYVLCFCGFSVKAAMFPFSGWLPKARCCADSGHGPSSCGSSRKSRGIYCDACDVL